MKAYHHQRGLSLFEVSIATSVAFTVLLSFAPYYKKIMERGLVEQTAQRAKMVYEAAINYRLDGRDIDGDGHADHVWPSSTTALKDAGYLPGVALQTSWGGNIDLESAGEDLQMKFSLPERFVNAVAAKLPVPVIDGMQITQLIVRPGQEASLSQLQDLAGRRAWTGSHNAGNNDLTNVADFQAKYIRATSVVPDGSPCEKEGNRAMIWETTSNGPLPAFCDGNVWKKPDVLQMPRCKVCIACSDGNKWRMAACDEADDDGWAISNKEVCADAGNLGIKFVCGPDSSEGYPKAQYIEQADSTGSRYFYKLESKLWKWPFEYYEDSLVSDENED